MRKSISYSGSTRATSPAQLRFWLMAVVVGMCACSVKSSGPAATGAPVAPASPPKAVGVSAASTSPPFAIGAAVSLDGRPSCDPLELWLAAVDSDEGGPPYCAKYFAGNPKAPPISVLLRDMAMLRDESGGFVPRRLVDASTCVVLAQRRADGLWTTLRVPPKPMPPRGALGPGLPEREDAPVPRDDDDRVEQVVGLADWLAAHDRFSGSIVIVHREKTLLSRAWGLASRAWNVPNRADTKFNLGSIVQHRPRVDGYWPLYQRYRYSPVGPEGWNA